uniref:Aminotransferase class V-fold PLP-dependent enzyme n=1 Tax=Fervidicoccus fontis TaxID=683846 RepID=A0A7J3SJA2_9CREN
MDKDLIDWIYTVSQADPRHENGGVLGSMTTPPPPEALKIVNHFISKNLGDPHLFKSLELITEKLVSLTRETLGLPPNMKGIITSGGTESNILALYSFRESLGVKKVVLTDVAHYSVLKASKMLGIYSEVVQTDFSGKFRPDDISKKIHGPSDSLVMTMGTTQLGGVEDPREILDDLNRIPIHVDAAFGGLTFPFINPEKFHGILRALISSGTNFTIGVDFHKFLGAPIPSGIIFVPEEIYPSLSFDVNYISSGKQFGLLGTRPGFSAAAALATLAYYGLDGLSKKAKLAYENTLWFLEEAKHRGLGFPVNRPEVPIACLSTDELIEREKLLEELAKRGFFVYRGEKCRGIRVVMMPHVRKSHLQRLLKVIEEVLISS